MINPRRRHSDVWAMTTTGTAGAAPAIVIDARSAIGSGTVRAFVSTAMFGLAVIVLTSTVQAANDRSWGFTIDRYSVINHSAAMTSLFAVATIAAAILLRQGRWLAALCTSAGAAFGPMVLLAAPLGRDVVTRWSESVEPNPGTDLWWRALVGSVTLAWVLLTAWWAARDRVRTADTLPGLTYPFILVGVGLVAFGAPGAVAWYAPEALALPILAGHLFLVAGVVTACATLTRIGATWCAMQVAVVGAVLLMYAAYNRDGGWPGVAGWEYGTSPIITTVATSAALVVAPTVGLLLGSVLRQAARSLRAVEVTRGAPARAIV
jgi:hypothetical protein